MWPELAKNDAGWRKLYDIIFKADHVHDAYYFRNFASVHKMYSDALIRAMKGSRTDIAQTLKASVDAIRNGATTN